MNIIADSTRVCNTEIHYIDESSFVCYYIKKDYEQRILILLH